ncbi:response regulator [Chloroflexia bacterium SDU3-3]|nr:response regulator [Chloroflexia bacterium SDU3-3]
MEEILIIDDSQQICAMLSEYVLPELGYRSSSAHTGQQGLRQLRQQLPDLILLDLQLPDMSGLDLLRTIAQEGYDVPVILMTAHGSEGIAVEAFRLGARNYLIKPFSEVEAKAVIDVALRERRLAREKDQLTRNLQQRVQELTVLSSIGKSVSSLIDNNELLVRIVEASVYITHAEEGFLLLHNPAANELYLRAAKNLGEQRAKHLRIPTDDTLAGQVMRTGKPIRLDKASTGNPLKVKTGFLVRSLLQVPLIVGKQVIGILGVDNQVSDRAFTENDQYLLTALADYAAIAIENTRLYEEVKSSEARYRDLFTNAYDLIFTLDRQLNIQSINRVGTALIGYSAEELEGQPLRSLCPPAFWSEALQQFSSLITGSPIQPFELQLTHKNGEQLTVEVSARLLREGQRIGGIHCIARDLTERRRLEEQLLQAEKLSAIGQLVAGVAHELNNPLTSISGYTQLLLREKGITGNTREDLQHIHIQAERAARIVQNLLVFAREHKPERKNIVINDVIRDTLALRSYQLRVDNIHVQLDMAPNLPQTVADPYQMQQVALNLINNAHQAMVERGGENRLTLRTALSQRDASDMPGGRPMVQFSVSDTGIGIPPSSLTRIFDPFYTTKPVGQGTGLGLAICFGIVQEHGGRIWAESEQGFGTTVFVEIPIRAPQAADSTTAEQQALPAEELQQVARILVVDDEEPVSSLLARLLRDLGHTPVVVNSGIEALRRLGQEPFDLVLTDVKMPGMTGFDLYQEIARRNPDLAARVVFVTGDMLSAATQAQIAQSGNPFIAKPFKIEQLEALVRSLLTRQSTP